MKIFILMLLLVVAGCTGGEEGPQGVEAGTVETPAPLDTGPAQSHVPQADRWSQGTGPTRQLFLGKVTPKEAYGILRENQDVILLDIRTPGEAASGHIPGADLYIDFHAPDFAERLDDLERDRTYIIYCQVGDRSAAALDIMADLGFERVYEIEGGFENWLQEGLPMEK
jgi:rhodanese-related sulfurtransferase